MSRIGVQLSRPAKTGPDTLSRDVFPPAAQRPCPQQSKLELDKLDWREIDNYFAAERQTEAYCGPAQAPEQYEKDPGLGCHQLFSGRELKLYLKFLKKFLS